MPEGEVLKKEGPQAKEKLGQILCANGDIISFFNTKNLDAGEPVIYDTIRTEISIEAEINGEEYNYQGMVPVGILPKDFDVDHKNISKKWPRELQERWKKEWAKYKDDEEINQKFSGNMKTSVKNHPQCD